MHSALNHGVSIVETAQNLVVDLKLSTQTQIYFPKGYTKYSNASYLARSVYNHLGPLAETLSAKKYDDEVLREACKWQYKEWQNSCRLQTQ